jgi:hypothetical protein
MTSRKAWRNFLATGIITAALKAGGALTCHEISQEGPLATRS